MKLYLKRLNMNFAQFTSFSLDLDPGFNMILGKNEAGKSTIANFIYRIFYGFYKDGKKPVKDTGALDFYRPWYSEKFLGSIELSIGEDDYQVYRNFETGEYRVINLSKSKEVNFEDPRDPGKFFFGMGPRVFKNILAIDSMDPWIDKNDQQSIKNVYLKDFYKGEKKSNFDGLRAQLVKRNTKIGTDRISGKDLGQVNQRIEDIEKKLLDLNKDLKDFTTCKESLIKAEKDLYYYKNIIRYEQDESQARVGLDEYEETLSLIKDFNDLNASNSTTNLQIEVKDFLFLLVGFVIGFLSYLFNQRLIALFAIFIGFLLTLIKLVKNNLGRQESESTSIEELREKINNIFDQVGARNLDEYRDMVDVKKTPNYTLFTEKKVDFDEIRLKVKRAENDVNVNKAQVNYLKNQVKKYRDLKEELKDLYQEKTDLIQEIAVNDLIISAIDETENELGEVFQKDIAKTVSEIFNYLTKGKYSRILLNEDYKLYVYDKNKMGFVDARSLSSGTIQLLNISYRISMHQYKSEIRMPLFLDDVSISLDEDRTKSLFEFLRIYSRENQVLYFSKDFSLAEKNNMGNNTNIIYLRNAL